MEVNKKNVKHTELENILNNKKEKMKIREIIQTSFSVVFSTAGRMVDRMLAEIHQDEKPDAAGSSADDGLRGPHHPEHV